MTPNYKRKKAPKRSKLPSVKSLRLKLWNLCKEITRKRYKRSDGTWICYTCGRFIDEPAKAHTGHGIPSSVGGIELRFNLNNLRIQDYYCNINLGGNGGEFYRRLVLEIGQDKVDDLYRLKGKVGEADRLFYQSKIGEYEML